jgi:hypothetical protein
MLETIRAVAEARLAAGDTGTREAEVRRAHASAYCDLAERAAADWGTRHQAGWLSRLARDHANLHGAMTWSIRAGEPTLARRLSGSLWRYWLMRGGLQEGRRLADAVLSMPGEQAADPTVLGALDAAGSLAYWAADPHGADAIYRRQLDVALRLDDPAAIGDAAFNLAHTQFILDDPTEYAETVAIGRRAYGLAGDARGLLRFDVSRAVAEGHGESPDVSRVRNMALLDRARQLDDLPYVALVAGTLAITAMRAGDLATTLGYGILGIRVNHLLADRPSSVLALLPASLVATFLGRPVEAAWLYGAFDAMSRIHGFGPPADLAQFGIAGDPAAGAHQALGDEAFATALARGRTMSLDEAVAVVEDLGRVAGVTIPEV